MLHQEDAIGFAQTTYLRLAHKLGLSLQGLHPSAPDAAWPRREEGDRV
jgi:hypothetical protein